MSAKGLPDWPATADGARVGPGAYIAPRARLEVDAVIEPNAVILASSDPDEPPTIVEHGATVGANATILPGLVVGFESRVLPGAVVTRSVPPRAIADGNPAYIVGYVDADLPPVALTPVQHGRPGPRASRVRGVTFIQLPSALDMRGSLAAAEIGQDVPFVPQRWFVVYGVPSAETRGQHAHRRCQQLLIAVAGSVRVVADDGTEREEFQLDRPTSALYLPAMTWGVQFGYSPDAVLLVLASLPYDPDDYIRDYAEYLELVSIS